MENQEEKQSKFNEDGINYKKDVFECKVPRTKQYYAIFDRARMAYLGLMEKPNSRCAIRDFETITKDKNSQLNKTPEDFSLFKIGEFDEETGEFIQDTQKIMTATEVEM